MAPLGFMELIDRLYPDLHVATSHMNILEGRLIFPQLTNPDGRFVRYGDSKRDNGSVKGMLISIRDVAYRCGLTDLQHRAESYLKLMSPGMEADARSLSCGMRHPLRACQRHATS